MITPEQRSTAWPSINPGELRHQISIQSRGSVPTSAGRPQPWVTVWTGRAAIRALTQRELIQSGQITAQFTHTITFYWPGSGIAIGPGMQVIGNGKVFKIQVVDNVNEQNVLIKLMCLVLNETA